MVSDDRAVHIAENRIGYKKAIVIFKEDGNFFSRKLADHLVFLLKNVKLQPATPISTGQSHAGLFAQRYKRFSRHRRQHCRQNVVDEDAHELEFKNGIVVAAGEYGYQIQKWTNENDLSAVALSPVGLDLLIVDCLIAQGV